MGDPTQQEHDWEPGIAPSGLFWTVPISPWAIDVDGGGRARLRITDVAVPDYHDFSTRSRSFPARRRCSRT